jgi:hypothetical protein
VAETPGRGPPAAVLEWSTEHRPRLRTAALSGKEPAEIRYQLWAQGDLAAGHSLHVYCGDRDTGPPPVFTAIAAPAHADPDLDVV